MAELAAEIPLLLSSWRWAEPSGHMWQDWGGAGRWAQGGGLQLKIKMPFQADELLERW